MAKLPVPVRGPVPVAEYNRMSTENQQCSIAVQQEWNRAFAARHGMTIVATYADEGKSGLTLHRRDELKRLLNDVRCGANEWRAILVYDVTRWGRFQDPDESAFYEWACKVAGYAVIYTAEPFAEDGGPLSSVLKSMKRAMAGEYSRELSVKVHAGQRHFSKRGSGATATPATGFVARRRTTMAGPSRR